MCLVVTGWTQISLTTNNVHDKLVNIVQHTLNFSFSPTMSVTPATSWGSRVNNENGNSLLSPPKTVSKKSAWSHWVMDWCLESLNLAFWPLWILSVSLLAFCLSPSCFSTTTNDIRAAIPKLWAVKVLQVGRERSFTINK